MLFFLFSRSAPGTREAHLEQSRRLYLERRLRPLELPAGLYNKRLSFFGAIDGAETGFVEVVFHHVLGTGFAVNYEDFANLCGVLMREVILDELGVVAMPGEALDLSYLCAHTMVETEDRNDIDTGALEFSTEGVGRTVSYKQDGGAGVIDMIGYVMLHSSGLKHA